MSKRTQSIRSLFSPHPDDETPVEAAATPPRVASGAVRTLQESFSDAERDYQQLRDKLATGSISIDIDPKVIDPSPFPDRFEEQDPESFEAFKRSIAEHGQEVPILVRPHPRSPGRYQSAYGHRRLRAVRELGMPVKAYVRELTDEDLVVVQGIENSAREDPTFIERATFAFKIEEAGFQRSVTQLALSVDRAEVSRLIAIARSVPADVVDAIGRAPRAGRGRWQALADLLVDTRAMSRVREAMADPGFRMRHTDDRFSVLLAAAKADGDAAAGPGDDFVIRSSKGSEIARMTRSTKQCRIQFDRQENEAFATFLARKLPELYEIFETERSTNE